MKLTDWPAEDRPREKLLALGAEALTDAELLAIFLRTGVAGMNAVDLARYLLSEFEGLRPLLAANKQRFCSVKGLGEAKYAQLQALLEMSRRYHDGDLGRGDALTDVNQTRQFLISRLRDQPNEMFVMLLLDSQHRVISYKPVFYGTIDSAAVYPRVLVKMALDHQAAAVILAHNHPSGVAEPSPADRQITQRIVEAMALLDIRVLDHFVIGDGVAVSFAQRGLL